MKKFFLLAALASIALASCVKNEPAKFDSQKEITFTTPVLAVPTKTQEIPGTDYLSSSPSFGVYGWYVAGATYVADDATAYMHNVEVKYDSSINKDDDTGTGAWISDDAYYWPKQGSITFDAYSPYSINTLVTGDKTNGLTITGFGVTNVLDDQVDLLYSTRAYDKTSSKGTTNDRYDGVDIVFNHALSVVKFTARTAADYSPTTTIKVTKIQIVDALTKATFEQHVDNSAKNDAPVWVGYTADKATFTSLDTSEGSATALSETAEDRGVSMIVLPQDFTVSTKLYIEYYIKTGSSAPIKQTFEISLNDSGFSYTEGGSSVTVTGWEIGKRYTYNLVIGLDKIYFAPSVTDWTDVNVTVPQI